MQIRASETPMVDTIKTGSTPNEEGALIPESWRFKSEPWILFLPGG